MPNKPDHLERCLPWSQHCETCASSQPIFTNQRDQFTTWISPLRGASLSIC